MARGAAYPFIGLEQAVSLTRALYDFAKRSPANLAAVIKEKWEYSPTSSSTKKILAALKYFGLVDIAEGEKGETIKITDRAYRILVDTPDSPERQKALRDAFLSAKAYKLCWDRWGPEMPPSMRSTLIFEEGFIDSTVGGFLANYRKSLQFAGLLDATDGRGDSKEATEDEDSSGPDAGVQSPSAPPAQTVQARSHPEPTAGGRAFGGALQPLGVGMRQEVFALAEGDVTIQWPERLSPDSLQDFTDWLRILERKIKRNVVQPEVPVPRRRIDLDDDEQTTDLA